jgi:hypothetical protein
MGRDRDRGKGGGRGGRGGGKMFIANEDEMALREAEVRDMRQAQKARRAEEEGGEGEGAGGDDEGGDEGGDSVFAFDRGGTKPAAGGGGGGLKVKELKDALPSVGGPIDPEKMGMNRREREAMEEQKRKEDYQRRHMAGETFEAKKELARLAEVRARREAAAAERAKTGRPPGWTKNGIDEEQGSSSSSEEESSEDEDPEAARAKAAAKAVAAAQEAQRAAIAEKKKAAAAAPAEDPASTKKAAGGGEPEKLKPMDIKKMNGDALKDALKERNLPIQGNKNDLIKRLSDYEAARA